MDPLSHVLVSRTLIALDHSRRLGPRAAAACGLGALAPDVDAVFVSRGWDVYLRVHEIGTHSLLGSLVAGSAAAALVHALPRRGRYLSLMLAAWIGALSHVALDLISGATLKPGWPLRQERLSVPLVAMADPWLVIICVAGALAMWLSRRKAAVAGGVLAAIGAFLVLKAVLMATAVPHWMTMRGSDAVVSYAVEAQWGSLLEWNVFDRTPHTLRHWRVSPRGARATLLYSLPLSTESPLVAASRSLGTVRNFLHVHQFGFAVVVPFENGDAHVLWSDIRYCRPGTGTVTARTSDGSPLACALWFGGIFDREGRPVTQIVRVRAWQQSRPVLP